MRKRHSWVISHGRDGFKLHVRESSQAGTAVSWLIQSCDMEWFGQYRNIPFCWINPWGWTWKVGREEHTLGDAWMALGQRVLNFADRLERTRELYSVTLADDVVREKFPESWEFFAFLVEDDEAGTEGKEEE